MEHKCEKAKEIESMNRKVDKICHTLYGNGVEGVLHTSQLMAREITNLTTVLTDIQANVQVLLRFQTQIETKDEVTHEVNMEKAVQRRWMIGLAITAGMSFITLLIGAVVFIMKI